MDLVALIEQVVVASREIETLNALKEDNRLSKNSVNMSYYLWLTLAISILGITITKIK